MYTGPYDLKTSFRFKLDDTDVQTFVENHGGWRRVVVDRPHDVGNYLIQRTLQNRFWRPIEVRRGKSEFDWVMLKVFCYLSRHLTKEVRLLIC